MEPTRPRFRWILLGLLVGLPLGLIVCIQPTGAQATFRTVGDAESQSTPSAAELRQRDDMIRLVAGGIGGPIIGALIAFLIRRYTAMHWLVDLLILCWGTGLLIGIVISIINVSTPSAASISPDRNFVIFNPPMTGLIFATMLGVSTGAIAALGRWLFGRS